MCRKFTDGPFDCVNRRQEPGRTKHVRLGSSIQRDRGCRIRFSNTFDVEALTLGSTGHYRFEFPELTFASHVLI
jgi:hypothetical protein